MSRLAKICPKCEQPAHPGESCWIAACNRAKSADWRREATPLTALAYVYTFSYLKKAANELGYALTVHGSLSRDLDLVAVPWTEEAATLSELINRLETETHAALSEVTEKPHGRRSVLLVLPHGAVIDLSIMPRSPI